MRYDLIIFDLDGTLLNTIGDLAEAANVMLRKRNLPQHTYEEYCTFVGNGIMRLVERALPEELRTAESVAAARQDFLDYYFAHIDQKTKPYEGIDDLLGNLQANGVLLAVASNKFQAGTRELIHRFFPEIRWVAVYGQRPDVPLKPDPAVVEEILSDVNIPRERVLYVGDSGVDIETAHRAGIKAVGVTWGFRSRSELETAGADRIVDRAEEIFDLCQA
ncbi:MAG: HAD family hydrolase [Alistipes sp.]|nr:HAD family hydrolase [Alistipes sp.]